MSSIPKIRRALHPVNPYHGFDPDTYPHDVQSWGSEHDFFREVIKTQRPSVIFEVGSWKGNSAIHMAQIARELYLDVEIVCIDTWLGSSEHILDQRTHYESFRHVNGYPHLYYTFIANVMRAGVQDYITPFPTTSETAAIVLKTLGAKAQFIYIDAAHEYEPAYRDISVFWDLLDDNGVMMCDDYGYCDVTAAVCTFAGEVKCPVYGTYGKALLSKNNERAFHLELKGFDP